MTSPAPAGDSVGGRTLVAFQVPVRTKSLTNARGHWGKKAARAREERKFTGYAWLGLKFSQRDAVLAVLERGGRLRVLMTRVDPYELDDDNVRGALKSVRDEVARQLRVDDRDRRVAWDYDQRKGTAEVLVEISEVIGG